MEENDKPNIYRVFLDSKYPHLIKFREVAPGTYKHSINVSNFCESVALELGINTELIKVAAMYHDIGKIFYPEAFSENQNGKNVHEDLDPLISYQIITRHVGDSITYLLQIENMPREILNIVSQHHGNTILSFFYKASGSTLEDLYRYKCSQPQSIEAAVLMLCDSVEATARALSSNGKLDKVSDRKSVVNTTIQRLMDDGQLDNMKVGELKVVKKVLHKDLESIYHKREVYGDETNSVTGDDMKVGELK